MLLESKVAVIYGGGGGIGGAVARRFAKEGARVFVTGPNRASLDAVVADITAAGGVAQAAVVDALEEAAIDAQLEAVVRAHGRLDISFNAAGFIDPPHLGRPATELALDSFLAPLQRYATSWFLTARLAARRMAPQRSGVLLTVSALHGRMGLPLVGGYGVAQAAKEGLTRQLSAELAPHGIRVVGLRPQAMLETRTIRDAYEPRAQATGMSWAQWQQLLASRTHGRRLMTLEEMADLAAFAASDRGSALTGTTLNLTMGSVDD